MLRVLHAIDEIIVTPYVSRSPAEVQQCTSIKDAMRDQCVPQLAAFWHQVLVTFYQALPALATLALQNISSVRKVCACVCVYGLRRVRMRVFGPVGGRPNISSQYIEWIDINLIANDKFIPLFYRFLSIPELQKEVR